MSQKETAPGSLAKRRIAIEALLAGQSQGEAGKAAGVSRRTVVRWIRDPDFAGDLDRARAVAFASTLAALKAAASQAVRTLTEILKSKMISERRQAAREILFFSFKAKETEDFEARLSGLEKYLEEHKAGLGPSGSHRTGRPGF